MKKKLVYALTAVLGLCFCVPFASAARTDGDTSCRSVNIEYADNYGGGDEASVVYNNVFTRFIPAQEDAQAFWFYVYQKEKVWLCEGANEAKYEAFPQYVAVRIYEGQQEENIRAKYDVKNTTSFIITNHGGYTPFYFYAGNQEHAVLNQLRPDTVVVSAPFSGDVLAGFHVPLPLRQENCGEETPEFTQLLEAVTIL